jgi:hypothetical protein
VASGNLVAGGAASGGGGLYDCRPHPL